MDPQFTRLNLINLVVCFVCYLPCIRLDRFGGRRIAEDGNGDLANVIDTQTGTRREGRGGRGSVSLVGSATTSAKRSAMKIEIHVQS